MIKAAEKIEEYTNIHLDNYKNASIEIIRINTERLVDEDITSLIKEPPLISMDGIKNKILTLSKDSNMIVKTEKLNELLSQYREELLNKIEDIKDIRNEPYINEIMNFTPTRDTEIIDLDNVNQEKVNRKICRKIREYTKDSLTKNIVANFSKLYKSTSEEEKINEIELKFKKYLKTTYLKQLKENVQIKIMVKDRTLINMVAEQGERYLFTKENSYIFKKESIT